MSSVRKTFSWGDVLTADGTDKTLQVLSASLNLPYTSPNEGFREDRFHILIINTSTEEELVVKFYNVEDPSGKIPHTVIAIPYLTVVCQDFRDWGQLRAIVAKATLSCRFSIAVWSSTKDGR